MSLAMRITSACLDAHRAERLAAFVLVRQR
jgi:hypothetical protein